MNLEGSRVRQTALLFALTFGALNAGTALARWEIGVATRLTVISAVLSASAIVLFLAASLWEVWKDRAPRP
jgi:hypothetical protein